MHADLFDDCFPKRLDSLTALLIDELCIIDAYGCSTLDELEAFFRSLLYPSSFIGICISILWTIVLIGLSQVPAVPLCFRLQHYDKLDVSAKDSTVASIHDFFSRTDGETSLVPEQHHSALQRARGETAEQSKARELALNSLGKGQVGDMYDEYGIWEKSKVGMQAYILWQICGILQIIVTLASLISILAGCIIIGTQYGRSPCVKSLFGVSILWLALPVVLLHPIVIGKFVLLSFYGYNLIQCKSINTYRARASDNVVARALLQHAKAEEGAYLNRFLRYLIGPPCVIGIGCWVLIGGIIFGITLYIPLVLALALLIEILRRFFSWCHSHISIKPDDIPLEDSDDEEESDNHLRGRFYHKKDQTIHPIMNAYNRKSSRLFLCQNGILRCPIAIVGITQRCSATLYYIYRILEEAWLAYLADGIQEQDALVDSLECSLLSDLFVSAFWWTDHKRYDREIMIKLAKASIAALLFSSTVMCGTLTALCIYTGSNTMHEVVELIKSAYTEIIFDLSFFNIAQSTFDVIAVIKIDIITRVISSPTTAESEQLFTFSHALAGANLLIAAIVKPILSFISARLTPLQSTEFTYRTWLFIGTMVQPRTTRHEQMKKEIRRLKKKKSTNDDALRRLRLQGYTLGELLPTQKFRAKDYRLAGYSCFELYNAGMSPKVLVEEARFNANKLKEELDLDAQVLLNTHKIPPVKLKTVKFTLPELYKAGASLRELKRIGYTAGELRFQIDISLKELLDVGFSPFALVHSAKASIQELQKLSFSAREIRFLDFTLDQLMQEGKFTLTELRQAGYLVSDFHRRRAWAPEYFSLIKLKTAG